MYLAIPGVSVSRQVTEEMACMQPEASYDDARSTVGELVLLLQVQFIAKKLFILDGLFACMTSKSL